MDRTGGPAEPGPDRGAPPALPAALRGPVEQFAADWGAGERPAASMAFEGYFDWMNEHMRRWWGWSDETLRGVDWWEFVHPEHQEHMVAVVEAVMNRQRFAAVPFRALRADGHYRWLLLDLVAEPEVEQVFGMVREGPAATSADRVPVGEWGLSPTTAELTLSPAAARIVGLPAGTGLDLGDLAARLDRRDHRRLAAELAAGWAGGESLALDVRLDADGAGPGTAIRFVAARPDRVPVDGRPPTWHGFIRQLPG
jgi:PAS domain S-box-containing protein